MDVWLSVQRKWLYMEGIFAGDVRHQIPEEARTFEDIDQAFRKVRGLPELQLNRSVMWTWSCIVYYMYRGQR
jgi:hypothetical protein